MEVKTYSTRISYDAFLYIVIGIHKYISKGSLKHLFNVNIFEFLSLTAIAPKIPNLKLLSCFYKYLDVMWC